MMEQPNSFGDWVRRRRKALDLTQEHLAQQVGCALATIKKIEAVAGALGARCVGEADCGTQSRCARPIATQRDCVSQFHLTRSDICAIMRVA